MQPTVKPFRNNAAALTVYGRELLEAPNRCLPAWLVPGIHSRHVLAMGTAATTVIGGTATCVSYQVPSGRIFSLRGVSIIVRAAAFVVGDGSYTFTLTDTSGGTRNVDFLSNLTAPIGDERRPYPIGGRLEFDSLDTLAGTVKNVSCAAGPPNLVTWILWGHTYPESER